MLNPLCDQLGGLNKRVVSYFYDDDVGSYMFNQGHPMKPFKVKMTDELIETYDLKKLMKPMQVDPDFTASVDFTIYHSDDYVDVLKNLTLENKDLYADQINRFNFGEDCPIFDGMYDYCQISQYFDIIRSAPIFHYWLGSQLFQQISTVFRHFTELKRICLKSIHDWHVAAINFLQLWDLIKAPSPLAQALQKETEKFLKNWAERIIFQIYTAGSLRAAMWLNQGLSDISINWAGGLHHAKKMEASGFCYVNDCVMAILELLKTHERIQKFHYLFQQGRILYIDIDCHHGDGVEEAFFTTDRVLCVSFHKFGDYFPGTGSIDDIGAGAGYSVNYPLNDGNDDFTFEQAFKPVMREIMARFKPNAIVHQCGTDSLSGDRLGLFNLSIKGHGEAVAFMRTFGVPMLLNIIFTVWWRWLLLEKCCKMLDIRDFNCIRQGDRQITI